MKKLITIVCIILFFLLILGALLFKLLGSSGSNSNKAAPTQTSFPTSAPVGVTSDQPDAFARSFYVWYLQNLSADPEFPHPENRDAVLKDWLSPTFLANWDQIQSDGEASPVFLTGESISSWGTSVTASLTSQLPYVSTVELAIGPQSAGHIFTIKLIRATDGSWRIDSISNAY
jgi:hypothetical protein